MARLNFRVTDDIRQRLAKKAEQNHRDMSHELRYILDLYLDGKLIPSDTVTHRHTQAQDCVEASHDDEHNTPNQHTKEQTHGPIAH